MIASAVAGIPGASRVLMGGIVSYDSCVKHELLGVEQEVIDGVGVVSETCAMQMAAGAREALRVDAAVSATGVAGPGGGTTQTPVGTVFIGLATAQGAWVRKCCFKGGRQSVRRQAAVFALKWAVKWMEERK